MCGFVFKYVIKQPCNFTAPSRKPKDSVLTPRTPDVLKGHNELTCWQREYNLITDNTCKDR